METITHKVFVSILSPWINVGPKLSSIKQIQNTDERTNGQTDELSDDVTS